MSIDRRTVLAAAGGLGAVGLTAEGAEAAARGNMSAASVGAIPKIDLKWAFTVIIFFKDRYVIQSRPTRALQPTCRSSAIACLTAKLAWSDSSWSRPRPCRVAAS